jgi:ribonuclease R
LCFSAVFDIDIDGKVHNEWFGRTVIHSDHRLTYEHAQAMIDYPHKSKQEDIPEESREITCNVMVLNNIAKKLREQRVGNGSVMLTSNEPIFELDENDKAIGIKFDNATEAHNLIEEFMLLANRSVCKLIAEKNKICVFRVHDNPDQERLHELREYAGLFGYPFSVEGGPGRIRESINNLVELSKDNPEAETIQTMITKSMAKAQYHTDNIGHYGLGFEFYTHFTSPIRRYPDILAHRLLQGVLEKKNKFTKQQLAEDCEHCSKREVVAMKASRESVAYKQAEFLGQHIGKVFEGTVMGLGEYGAYVRLRS